MNNIKLKLSPELDFTGYLNDIDTIKSIYKEHKDYLVDKTGLTPNDVDDAWSDFISDLIGDEWKLEDINTVDDFLNMFLDECKN